MIEIKDDFLASHAGKLITIRASGGQDVVVWRSAVNGLDIALVTFCLHILFVFFNIIHNYRHLMQRSHV